jgi:DNA invertase Pin-like site-specific DNA recombinase
VLGEFEQNLNAERSKAGQEVARKAGKRFGRPPKLTPALVRQIKLAHDDPEVSMVDACRSLGISKSTNYNGLKLSV